MSGSSSSVKDERWDPSNRRQLRQELREKRNATEKNREDITIAKELVKRVKEGDDLYKRIVSSREAAIDSDHFKILSEIAREQAQQARGELVTFEPVVFAEKLKTFMGGRDGGVTTTVQWDVLGERAIKAFKLAPRANFIYGSLEVVPPIQRTRRAATKRTATTATVQPQKITALDNEEESTTKDVKKMFSALKEVCDREEVIHYFTFLLDPDSFARSVENIFHFSFLIKEGKAGVKILEDGQPYIFLVKKTEEERERERPQKVAKNQTIVSINMDQWKRAIEKFKITKAFITD